MGLSQVVGRLIGVREHVVDPGGGGAPRVPRPVAALVVGGGIAGMSAAVVLAERGVAVTVLEAAPHLGGRLGAWPEELPDGAQRNEHGFHAFFRQYWNWRSILRRVDPELGFLKPIPGYPILSEQWPTEEFGKLPPAPPANLLALLLRSPSLRLADLRVDGPGRRAAAAHLRPGTHLRGVRRAHGGRAAHLAAAAGPGAGHALRGLLALVLQPRGGDVGRRDDRPVPLLSARATRRGWRSTARTGTTRRRSGSR